MPKISLTGLIFVRKTIPFNMRDFFILSFCQLDLVGLGIDEERGEGNPIHRGARIYVRTRTKPS